MSNKVKCSHILVEKQSQALEILEEIKKGKKFGAAAKEISTCPSSKKEGDLGYFTKGMMVKEFVFGLIMGQILGLGVAALAQMKQGNPTPQDQMQVRDMAYKRVPQIRERIFDK